MGKAGFERKLAALEALRNNPGSKAAQDSLRKALADRSNYIVAKAAKLAASLRIESLLPSMVQALDRSLDGAEKIDPQCWAKNALAQALYDLDYREPEWFLRGVKYTQIEPIWNAQVDTAETFRGICALGLTGTSLPKREILRTLTDVLADPAREARIGAARGIGLLDLEAGVPLLHFKARIGDEFPEVTGACFQALLAIEPQGSLSWVGEFLDSLDPDTRFEAATALVESRQEEAISLVIAQISQGADRATASLRALALLRSSLEIHDRVQKAAEWCSDRKVIAAFQELFGARPG